MSKFTIIRTAEKLDGQLDKFAGAGPKYRNLLHLLAVSVLVHANEHGNLTPLRRFDKHLTTAEKTKFATYVRHFQTERKDGKVVKSQFAFLTKTSGEWEFDPGHAGNRGPDSPFVKHAEENLINPDGEVYRRFYEDCDGGDKQPRVFGDDNLLRALSGLLKKAKAEQANVSGPLAERLEKFVSEASELSKKIGKSTRTEREPILHDRTQTAVKQSLGKSGKAAISNATLIEKPTFSSRSEQQEASL